jgi:DNA-directed RNA polymerase specialized sigma24 family protein
MEKSGERRAGGVPDYLKTIQDASLPEHVRWQAAVDLANLPEFRRPALFVDNAKRLQDGKVELATSLRNVDLNRRRLTARANHPGPHWLRQADQFARAAAVFVAAVAYTEQDSQTGLVANLTYDGKRKPPLDPLFGTQKPRGRKRYQTLVRTAYRQMLAPAAALEKEEERRAESRGLRLHSFEELAIVHEELAIVNEKREEIAAGSRPVDAAAIANVQVSQLLRHLSDDDKKVLLMRQFGFTSVEIATKLNITTAAVDIRVHRARAAARTILDGFTESSRKVAADSVRYQVKGLSPVVRISPAPKGARNHRNDLAA